MFRLTREPDLYLRLLRGEITPKAYADQVRLHVDREIARQRRELARQRNA